MSEDETWGVPNDSSEDIGSESTIHSNIFTSDSCHFGHTFDHISYTLKETHIDDSMNFFEKWSRDAPSPEDVLSKSQLRSPRDLATDPVGLHRRVQWKADILQTLAVDVLDPGLAAKFCGRFAFLNTHLFNHVGRALTRPLIWKRWQVFPESPPDWYFRCDGFWLCWMKA